MASIARFICRFSASTVSRRTASSPPAVWQAGPVKIGMNICYDGSFPEASRIMALDGAELIVLPTNWPPAAKCFAEHTIPTRAMENHVYYMSVNRIGTERGFRFIGKSMICHPLGEILAAATGEEETILTPRSTPLRPQQASGPSGRAARNPSLPRSPAGALRATRRTDGIRETAVTCGSWVNCAESGRFIHSYACVGRNNPKKAASSA